MAFFKNFKSGKKFLLLNPSEKSKRYARQLKSGVDKDTGVVLSDADKSYRSGYLTARRDNADAYNSKHNPAKLKAAKKKRAEYRKNKKSTSGKKNQDKHFSHFDSNRDTFFFN